MLKTEHAQMVWMELYLAVVEYCEKDRSAHCDAFAVERRNHLGSVTRIYNTSGTAVFSAQYDPWGVQTVTTNTIKYNRGYCGHAMPKQPKRPFIGFSADKVSVHVPVRVHETIT